MLGSIIGDIAGSFREFTGDEKFPHLPLLPEYSDIPFEYTGKTISDRQLRYGITDDTILTTATAHALLQYNHSPITDKSLAEHFEIKYKDYANKHKNPIGGFGASFNEWAITKGSLPYNSCGNGSAMRVSPVGYFAESHDEAVAMAFDSAICTHNHPEGIKGAQATALMVFLARQGWKLDSIIYSLEKSFLSYKPISGYDHFDHICQETMPLVMHCLLETDNFVDAVFKAVTIPHADSDTVGAIVGSIAEPLYGIPEEIAAKAESMITDKEILNVYNAFKEGNK